MKILMKILCFAMLMFFLGLPLWCFTWALTISYAKDCIQYGVPLRWYEYIPGVGFDSLVWCLFIVWAIDLIWWEEDLRV